MREFLVALALAGIIGIVVASNTRGSAPKPAWRFDNVTHDGHLWVINGHSTPVHHPDCPCHRAGGITPAEIEGRAR